MGEALLIQRGREIENRSKRSRSLLPRELHVPATEELPKWVDSRGGLVIAAQPGERLNGRTEFEAMLSDGERQLWRVRCEVDGGALVAPRAGREQGHLSTAELLSARDTESGPFSGAFRPSWLAQNAFPRLIPRRRKIDLSGILPGLTYTIERGELTFSDWPWCTVGRVFVGTVSDYSNWTSSGSGVLVGPNLILTASHVAPWGVDGWWMRFVPSYRDGTGPFGDSYVSQFRGHRSDAGDEYDYVICQLYDSLGDRAGWMGTYASTDDSFYEDRNWTSIGYPGDFMGGERPAVEWAVEPDDAEAGDGTSIDFEPPFTSPGWSGGPLFGWVDDQPRTVGVLRGEEETDVLWVTVDDDTVFSGGMHMVDLVKYGLANWPPS
jgi:hypothetical protein